MPFLFFGRHKPIHNDQNYGHIQNEKENYDKDLVINKISLDIKKTLFIIFTHENSSKPDPQNLVVHYLLIKH